MGSVGALIWLKDSLFPRVGVGFGRSAEPSPRGCQLLLPTQDRKSWESLIPAPHLTEVWRKDLKCQPTDRSLEAHSPGFYLVGVSSLQ